MRTPSCRKILNVNHQIPEDKIEIFLSAFDQGTFFHKKVKKDIDVLFVGAITERRSHILTRLKSVLGDRLIVTKAFGDELNNLLNRARIILNIHGTDHLDTETRVFEVLGSGGFLITEKLSNESPFIPGIDLIECATIDEIIQRTLSFLIESRDESRIEIANAGYQKVLAHHTYFSRSKHLARKFENLKGVQYDQRAKPSYTRAKLEENIMYLASCIRKPAINFYHKLRTS
ncbi:MAG: glycosyltransferase [Bacteroidota bacterium]